MYIVPFPALIRITKGKFMDKWKINSKRRAKKRAQKLKKMQKAQNKQKRKIKINFGLLRQIASWIMKIGIACLLAFVFVWYFGQQISTVGDSMTPILNNGDVVLVNRIVYDAMSPRRGDIIVFKPKGNENSHYYTKRIIGLPGETLEIIEGSVYIDGEKLEEEYETTEIKDVGIITEKIKLAGDEYFVLGDSRENSEDSRMADVGTVKRSYIYGKAWFVIAPWQHFGIIKDK